jgi:diacylglycerol kinase (ATP)
MKNSNLAAATRAAASGLRLVAAEKAFQRELLLLAGALLALVLLPSFYTAGMLAVAVLVLAFEAFNTAIERLCDMVQPEFDLRVKAIKDLAAAAIFILVMFYGLLAAGALIRFL